MSACAAQKAQPGALPWICTRERGHAGLHWAEGLGGVIVRRWRRKPVSA